MGMPELLLILVVVLIIFGAGKLPKVMKDLGSGVKAFREGMDGAEKPAASETSSSSEPKA
jgi:sec-independent protein translocase protein TatA